MIEYFASRSAMDIDGLGPATVEALLKAGYLKNIADIYYLKNHRKALIRSNWTLEGETNKTNKSNKVKSTDNLLQAIERSKENDIDRLLTDWGFQRGLVCGQYFKAEFPGCPAVAAASFDQLITLNGLGETIAQAIIDYFAQPANQELLERLAAAGSISSQGVPAGDGCRLRGLLNWREPPSC